MPDGGCIYVARNDEINPPNLYKIGKTEFFSPTRRMKELSNETTNWNGEYHAVAWVQVDDVSRCEKIMHRVLADKRVRRNREFFFEDINEIIEKIKIYLNDFIIPGQGVLKSFDIHKTSIKITNDFLNNKKKSIFDLFNFVNKNTMCADFRCWNDYYAFQRSLIIIISNSLKISIKKEELISAELFIRKIFEKKYYTEFCKQISNLSEDDLYLYKNKINDEKEQHKFILSKKSLKPKIIENILQILNLARQDNKELLQITKNLIKNTPINEIYISKYKKHLKELRNIRIENKLETERKLLKKKLDKTNRIEKLKQHKLNKLSRDNERIEYLNKFKSLNLVQKLKFIINNDKFGLGIFPKNLIEKNNFVDFYKNFQKLDQIDQKKFVSILKKNRQSYYKTLFKKITDKKYLAKFEWNEFINSDKNFDEFKYLKSNFKINDEDLDYNDIPNFKSTNIDKLIKFSQTIFLRNDFQTDQTLYDDYFKHGKFDNSIKNLRILLFYIANMKNTLDENAMRQIVKDIRKLLKSKK